MANVVELIATMLKREGVQYIFGIPGGEAPSTCSTPLRRPAFGSS
jgi:thiamine pyrophosphate-dependent acetolactate synthase large subunit-like protein